MRPTFVRRFAGRLANGQFDIGAKTYCLATNDHPSHLHGGVQGFDRRLWDARFDQQNAVIEFTYVSPAGDQSYPGTLTTVVRYTLTDNNELRIEYEAKSDAPNHADFPNVILKPDERYRETTVFAFKAF